MIVLLYQGGFPYVQISNAYIQENTLVNQAHKLHKYFFGRLKNIALRLFSS